ncbi:MAG: 50S ribosomal protein L35 [Kiritimatiellae bacterium]|nr:50S ribosomal protein L35 [Kiritimatiellia bacterium]
MPKQKTKKSVAKRFKLTARGKVKRSSCSRGHLFTGKSRKRKRQLKGGVILGPADHARIAIALNQ